MTEREQQIRDTMMRVIQDMPPARVNNNPEFVKVPQNVRTINRTDALYKRELR